MLRTRRDFDVVVYGASGFTGKIISRYLLQHHCRGGGAPPRLALAGRCKEKLRALRDEIAVETSADPELLACDAFDSEGLGALAARAQVVIAAAGPFALCGSPLVAACVAQGTDYVDINGEVPWVRDIIQRFDAPAAAKGTLIVPNCGYSVLADLGAYHASMSLQGRGTPTADPNLAASSVRAFMQFNGRLSGGTMATGLLLDEADEATQAVRRDPFALGGRPDGAIEASDHADCEDAEYEPKLGCWSAPFWMAPINSRVVRRSAQLFRQAQEHQEWAWTRGLEGGGGGGRVTCPYGPQFSYRERALASDESVARNLAASRAIPTEKRRKFIERGKLPAPGQGPSDDVRAKSWFRLFFWAEAEGPQVPGSRRQGRGSKFRA